MEQLLASPATLGLIIANIAASLYAFQSRSFLEQNLFVVGPILKGQQWYRILTSGFLHGGGMHLFVNMLTLYSFGPFLEATLGVGPYLLVYFAALIGGSAWMLMEHRRELQYAALGASGAVSGVLIGVCLFYPFATLGVFFIVPMPAFLFAIIYIALSAYFTASGGGGRIAHDAHLGGVIVGGLVTVLIRPDAWTRFITALTDALPF